METDPMRAVFLEEFDAMADYVSPVQDLSPAPQPVAEPVAGADPLAVPDAPGQQVS